MGRSGDGAPLVRKYAVYQSSAAGSPSSLVRVVPVTTASYSTVSPPTMIEWLVCQRAGGGSPAAS